MHGTYREEHVANDDKSGEKKTEKHRDRTIGRGMDSPDSTQMPLDATTGEPDWRTQKKGTQDKNQSDKTE